MQFHASRSRACRWGGGAICALLLTAAGCAASRQDPSVFLQAHEHDVAATNYRIAPPDVIQIASPTAPEIDGEIQQVRADGKLSLNLLGEVQAAGLTPRELSTKLEEALARYYVSPEVNVQVAQYESKKVYVFGQVGRPGAYAFTGRDSVMDLLARAQPTYLAWGAQVKVIRPSAAPTERREVVVNVDEMTQNGDLRGNFLLQEGDVIYVPPTPLAWMGLRVREVLFPFTPVAEAYQMPAGAIHATNVYNGNYRHDDDHRRGLLRR